MPPIAKEPKNPPMSPANTYSEREGPAIETSFEIRSAKPTLGLAEDLRYLHDPLSCNLENPAYTNDINLGPPGAEVIIFEVALPRGRSFISDGIAAGPFSNLPLGRIKWNEACLADLGISSRSPDSSASINEMKSTRFLASMNSTRRLNLVQGPQSAS